METIIKKSIEGGYRAIIHCDKEVEFGGANAGRFEKNGLETMHGDSIWTFKHNGSSFSQQHSITVLDPLFWQALGKACGWGEEMYANEEEKKVLKDMTTPFNADSVFIQPSKSIISGPLYYALKFHEINLTQGWDKAVEWLSDLIKK